MEDTRPDSEYLLKKLQYEEEQKLKKNKGKLKIFLGYLIPVCALINIADKSF